MENQYEPEKFLDQVYQNLYNDKEVRRCGRHVKSKYEAIRKYLQHLEYLDNIYSTGHRKEILRELYYQKYIIKEKDIPKSLNKEVIISDQKQTLDSWIDYLTDKKFPYWMKYWIFQGVVRIGSYDYDNCIYNKRSNKTTSPFMEVNNEIIENIVYFLNKRIKKEKINDEVIETLLKTGSFQKIYAFFEIQLKNNLIINSNCLDGIWVKYNQGSYEDAMKLVRSLKGKNTHWCSAHSLDAIQQICGNQMIPGGDFYAYYTKDIKGNYTVPRLAIRLIGKDKIVEIRGIANRQNIEREMEIVLYHKLSKMDFLTKKDIELTLDKLRDLQELTSIQQKINNKIPLNNEEVKDIYLKKFGFGIDNDFRAKKILEKRDILQDYEQVDDYLSKAEMFTKYFSQFPYDFKILDKDVALEVIVVNPSLVHNVDDSILYDRDFIIDAVKINGWLIKSIPEIFRNDKYIIALAVTQNIHILEFVSEDLKNDIDFMLELLSFDERAYDYANENLKENILFKEQYLINLTGEYKKMNVKESQKQKILSRFNK